MFDFQKIANGLYVFFDHGARSGPLTKDELYQALFDMPLSEVDIEVIDFFYPGV